MRSQEELRADLQVRVRAQVPDGRQLEAFLLGLIRLIPSPEEQFLIQQCKTAQLEVAAEGNKILETLLAQLVVCDAEMTLIDSRRIPIHSSGRK